MGKFKLILVASVLIAVAVFLSKSAFFVIKNINLNISNAPCIDSQTLLRVYPLKGENILFLNGEDLNSKIVAKYLCVDHIELKKAFPSTLDIRVVGRVPVATVYYIPDDLKGIQISFDKSQEATPSSSSAFESVAQSINGSSPSASFLSDYQGLLFARSITDLGQKLFVIGHLDLGSKLSSMPDILKIINKLNNLSVGISSVPVIKGNYLYVEGASPKRILLSLDSVDVELASLQLILQTGKMNSGETSMIDTVDLRFSKPVVVYSKGKN